MRIIIKESDPLKAMKQAQQKRMLEAYRREELNPDSRIHRRRQSSMRRIRDSWESFADDDRIK